MRGTGSKHASGKVIGFAVESTQLIELQFKRKLLYIIHLRRPTEGFYDTAVAMPFKFELPEIVPTEGGLNKRQRCAAGVAGPA